MPLGALKEKRKEGRRMVMKWRAEERFVLGKRHEIERTGWRAKLRMEGK